MSFSDPEMDGVHRDAPEGQDLTDRGVLIFADVRCMQTRKASHKWKMRGLLACHTSEGLLKSRKYSVKSRIKARLGI